MNDRTIVGGDSYTINICEIFASIQGEGRYMGCPVVFVRTSGCPVQCDFCDSKDSWHNSKTKTINEVWQEVWRCSRQGKIRTVVITGGEPLIQHNLGVLCDQLHFEGFQVHLETSGYTDIPRQYFDWVVCSPKPNLQYAIPANADEIKLVIGTHVDDIYKLVHASWLDKFAGRIWLQPCDEPDAAISDNMKRCYDMAMKDPRFRVGIQLHKLLRVQ